MGTILFGSSAYQPSTIYRPQRYTGRVTEKTQVSSKCYTGTFTLVHPQTIAFIAGQYAMFYIQETIHRSLSIASPPSENTSIRICYNTNPMGPGSKWMLGLKVGDPVECMAPLGVFIMDKTSQRKKVMVATGSGVSPLYSMMRDYLDNGGTNEITLYWGIRYEEDVFWQAELSRLARAHPNFTFLTTLSRPTDAWQGPRGRVTDHIFTNEKDLKASDYYICGLREMAIDVREKLLAHAVPREQIKSENFY